ncbi:proteasome subunit alpha [Arthrobacter sulfonylureivorans]|uniref:Proteasome subunit alpha n=1 Tax=Arthrobacter sulfonylureivorans TaxID=2486855 RepID=A0ABY3W2Z1_9MICC|nr:proteasome subunit alpha [Arthrobacter sulfonylureivorans]UNK44442.1 proteasome subunit alpha [Arthrobacter sulfonylureivorans]
MTQQFYVSPEQLMKDRADFARKGIARGRSVVVLSCSDGIALVAENPSPSLHKIGEIYDRIAFAAVGKYNEFESLRQAGVRYADVRGYSYDREDVTGRGLASVYAQSLGAVFTADTKPFEVELAVAEVGAAPAEDRLFRLTFDGSIADERRFVVMGGDAEAVGEVLRGNWADGRDYAGAVRAAVAALSGRTGQQDAGPAKELRPEGLEVAVLDRDPLSSRGSQRAFRRLATAELTEILGEGMDG